MLALQSIRRLPAKLEAVESQLEITTSTRELRVQARAGRMIAGTKFGTMIVVNETGKTERVMLRRRGPEDGAAVVVLGGQESVGELTVLPPLVNEAVGIVAIPKKQLES